MFARLARRGFEFFRCPSNQPVIDRLHGEIVAASRNPVLFTDFGIEDTFEGRFESVVLHASLVLRRLRALPAPATEVAQDLTDRLFKHFDVALRELGVGDGAVPKRMKVLAEAFLGRALAYDEALDAAPGASQSGLEEVLKRNVYAGRKDAAQLAAYVKAADAALSTVSLDIFTNGPVPFPTPSAIPMEAHQ